MTKRHPNLQSELRQRRPFRSVRQEGTLAILRTADVVRRHLATAIETSGVTLQQYNVLRILRGAGASGLPTLDVADRMIESTPGVTRLIDRLAVKGLVERTRSRDDRRQVICTITAEGLDLLADLDGVVDDADESALGALSEKETRILIDLLGKIRGGYPTS